VEQHANEQPGEEQRPTERRRGAACRDSVAETNEGQQQQEGNVKVNVNA
jgi:hypothetical protein